MNVSVIGLGKLGSPMAACLAAKGHRVTGVDIRHAAVDAINAGQPPVFEPGLAEMIRRAGGNLSATTDVHSAMLETDLTFLIVPTPSRPDGFFSLDHVTAAARSIAPALSQKNTRHVVVLTSTVMPGATGGELLPLLERESGRACPRDFGLCYSPEFISLGSVIRDYLHPDFVLIGESDEESGNVLAELYASVCENRPPVRRMNFVNAELTKLALNAFVTTKISYANMLAEVCERLPGGHVDDVTSALGLDSRIGPKYLKGSLGYGGPCFPRDSVALASLARSVGLTPWLPEATDSVNRGQVPRLLQIVLALATPDAAVAILGVAYKPETDVVERAQGLELAQALVRHGRPVVLCDPVALDSARRVLGNSVQYVDNVREAVRRCDVVVVCTPCKPFQEIQPGDLAFGSRQRVLIDCWRVFQERQLPASCQYIRWGTDDVMRFAPGRRQALAVSRAA